MNLASEELAAFTSSDYVFGIGHGRRPVKALAKGFPDQCFRRCMVTAYTLVYLLDDFSPVHDWDAS
jgi:hypothetical protein